VNILLITLDQFRGDCLSLADHPVVRTPNLDRLASSGTWLRRHYSQAAPCSPGRACLYTGTYQFNNRVVGNGTPLDDRFDNVARAGQRAGYRPTLFGYADQGIDPRAASGPDDPRLSTYESVPPGFDVGLELIEDQRPWLRWLEGLGYRVDDAVSALSSEPERPAERGISAFLTDRLLEWLRRQDDPWFLHASYLRPPVDGQRHMTPTTCPIRSLPPTDRFRSPAICPKNGRPKTRPSSAHCGPSTSG